MKYNYLFSLLLLTSCTWPMAHDKGSKPYPIAVVNDPKAFTAAIPPKRLVQVKLSWNASKSTDVVMYAVYWGGGSRNYSYMMSTTNLFITLPLAGGNTWYIASTAIDVFGLESEYSNEVVYKAKNPGNK